MSRREEDGCVIEDGQVEDRNNSATAYCREADADCYGVIDQPRSGGHKGAMIAAKLHTVTTGHKTAVESMDTFIVDVSKA